MIKTVCLCLPEYPERIEAAREHFEASGLKDVEFFYGINAELAGLATWHCYELDNPGTGFKMGTKPTGIWLSHYMLWSALARGNDEHYMIIETDAQFQSGWQEKLDEALSIVPTNFDFLHPGNCCVEPTEHLGGDVWKVKKVLCTHCYIVRRAVLTFVLRTIRKCYAPIDIQMQLECFPYLNVYAIVPRIVDQHNTVLSP